MMPPGEKCRQRVAEWLPPCVLALALLCGAARADFEDWTVATILDVTRRTVIVDKGEADGLQPQAEVRVFRNGRDIARLAVEYLAGHSAACTIIAAGEALARGDEVRFVAVFPAEETFPEQEPTQEKPAQGKPAPAQPAPGKPAQAGSAPEAPQPRKHMVAPIGAEPFRLRGRVALEWSYYGDAKDRAEDFEQSAVFVRLDGRRLWQRPLDFQVRLRTRYDHRSHPIGETRPATEWLNRVYQLSLTYDDPRYPVRAAFGRLFAARVPSAGNWDGALLEFRLGSSWQLFALGGGMPGLSDGEPDFDRQKVGGGLSLTTGEMGRRLYEGTTAFVGEYASGDVSREFIALDNLLSLGRALSLRQSLELDVNRGWRRDAAGESQTLSRLNADVLYRAGGRLQINLSYNYYQSVPRIESRHTPDSLRVDAELAGMRLGARVKLSRSVRIGGSLGYRDRRGEDKRPAYTNADLSISNLLHSGTDLVVRHAYADGRFADSHVPSLDLERSFGPTLRVGLGLGAQSYEGFQAEPFSLEGRWFTLHGTYRLSRPLELSWIWRRASGDVGAGDRFLLQLGCRW